LGDVRTDAPPVVLEIDAQDDRDAEDELPMRHRVNLSGHPSQGLVRVPFHEPGGHPCD